jgi:hypothetical protein
MILNLQSNVSKNTKRLTVHMFKKLTDNRQHLKQIAPSAIGHGHLILRMEAQSAKFHKG